MLILALDIGTSSSRAVLYDAQTAAALPGAIVSHKHVVQATPNGGATLDPNTLLNEVLHCIGTVLPFAENRPIGAVAVATFWHSLVGVGPNGAALTPVLLWADRRSAPQVEELRHVLSPADYSQRTGCPLHTSYLPGRLKWLRETSPETFAACARFVSPGEYLFAQWFGLERVTVSRSMASGTGLLNQATGLWDAETLAHLPLNAARLSPEGDAPISGLREPFASQFPALADIPWFPALGDGACSNIGCGATLPGTIALMIGTSGALRVVVKGRSAVPPLLPPGLWRYQIDGSRYVLGGALSNGGSVWAWLKRTLRLPEENDDALENELAALVPDAHGLTVLPFFAGERAPLWRDDLRATLHGLQDSSTPVEIARAHLEAIACRFGGIRDALRLVAPTGTVIGTGAGLLASPTWAQIIADALGEPIALSSEEQASARGAVLWAREVLGMGTMETAPPVPVLRTVAPNPANTAIYHAARDRQDALLARLMN